ncbi:MAG: cytochrome c biogenesis protein CcsA [Bacillota bacterium]
MIGETSIYLAFVAALVALICFIAAALGNRGMLSLARGAFRVMSAAIVFASVYLLFLLLTHQFQYIYVYSHTDRALPTPYLISAFWAGQEGTFLFWALCSALAGLLLLGREDKYEPWVMGFATVASTFLIVLMLVASPFATFDQAPYDGAGLNPLLFDPWMIIHPPVVFVGYAALVFPAAFAFAALAVRDYDGWVQRALPWTLFGWLALGAGIIIGGYWAYKVLGWGGYWGWDPVENASLVPWLTGTALLHGMLIQKARGSFKKANLLLSIITYVLIIYATYLTRSGVLADFSVHSFSEAGVNAYLGLFLLFFLFVPVALLLYRWKEIPSPQIEEGVLSRNFAFYATVLLTCLSAIVVSVGTSSPIITGLMGNASSVDSSYYVTSNAPLVLLLALTLAACPLMAWRGNQGVALKQKLMIPGAISLLVTAVAVILGVRRVFDAVFVLLSVLALSSNLWALLLAAKRGIKMIGGYLAHVGLAVMFIGILGSSGYSTSQNLVIEPGKPAEAFGYSFEFKGMVKPTPAKEALWLLVKGKGREVMAHPEFYVVEKSGQLMRSPHIIRGLFYDLYVSPLDVREPEGGDLFVLSRGSQQEAYGHSITFTGFDRTPHADGSSVRVAAILEVEWPEGRTTARPSVVSAGGNWVQEPAVLDSGITIWLEGIDADGGRVLFRVWDEEPGAGVAFIEVSKKPLVNVLWAGTVLLLGGTAVATWRRSEEKARAKMAKQEHPNRTVRVKKRKK